MLTKNFASEKYLALIILNHLHRKLSMPTDKMKFFPVFCLESFRCRLLTLSPLSRISSAFAPRTVQCTAIFSLRLIPKDLTVYLAFEKTGVWPVKDSKTLAARVKRSPLSPTQIFKHNLRMCNSLMGFLALLVFAVSAMA